MSDQSLLSSSLFRAASSGTPDEILALLAKGANPAASGSQALCLAAERGRVDCLRLLIPRSNPQAANCLPLRLAAERGHAQCVQELIPHSHEKGAHAALLLASGCGYAECVKFLLGACDARHDNSAALLWAASSGRADCVSLLLPASDPLACCGAALRQAIGRGHAGVVVAMLDHGADYENGCCLPSLVDRAIASGLHEVAAILAAYIERLALARSLPKGLVHASRARI